MLDVVNETGDCARVFSNGAEVIVLSLEVEEPKLDVVISLPTALAEGEGVVELA